MRIRESESEDHPWFNLTPMLDLTFNLLTFFMLATAFVNPEKMLDIQLPEAQSGEAPGKTLEELVINVSREGKVTLSGQVMDGNALLDVLKRAAQRNPTTPVTIRGDRLAHHQEIVRVMDACGTAGLSNLSVGTLEGS